MSLVTLEQARIDLRMQLECGVSTIILGSVGLGKTDLARLVAQDMNINTVIDRRLSQMGPTDFGLPFPDTATGRMTTYYPDWLPRVDRDGKRTMLLLDEYTDAQLGVQAASNQLTLERYLPGYGHLPDECYIVATGNTQKDRAAAQKVSRASANRLAIIEIKLDIRAWLNWANRAGIAAELVAFIQHASNQPDGGEQFLHCYPTQAGSDAVAFPTPRSIARCSPFLSMGLSNAELRRAVAHNVGDDWARTFMNYLVTYRLLPDLNAILADPRNAIVPREPSVNYALGVALVSKLDMANLPSINQYVERLDPLYRASFWSNAIGKDKRFAETTEHVRHLVTQSNVS